MTTSRGRKIPGTDHRADKSYGAEYWIIGPDGRTVGYAHRNSGRFEGHSYTVEAPVEPGTYYRPLVSTAAFNLTQVVEWLQRHASGDCEECEHTRKAAYAARLRARREGK